MIYIAIWMGLGLIAEALFIYGMRRRYPDFKSIDRGLFPFEIMICLLAGPVAFLALGVVFGNSQDED